MAAHAPLAVSDARSFLTGLVGADLILTDPPHLDNYPPGPDGIAEHADFTAEWLPLALKRAPVVMHSCGSSPEELNNYERVSTPWTVLAWYHAEGSWHRFLLYGAAWRGARELFHTKPDPLYGVLIDFLSKPGDLVADPFCGYGEIPRAALALGRRMQGGDINPVSIRDAFV